MKIIEGSIATPYARVAIVVARFNHFINQNLLAGALDTLKRIGQVSEDNITVVYVPGAYELPLATRCLVNQGEYDAIIALGSIIRGETHHFEYIASECSKGLAQIAIQSELPITFGVLTTQTTEQAIQRAGVKSGNKGAQAATSALEMINVLHAIKS